jgi:hypothetical protein
MQHRCGGKMEFSSTESYLALALASLENKLIHDLASQDAKATAEIVKTVLLDLIKRERYTPRLLAEHLVEGHLLAQNMAAFLGEIGNTKTNAIAPLSSSGLQATPGFNALAADHRSLTAQIAHLADQLVMARDKAADTSQQQSLSTLLHKAAGWEYAYYASQRDAQVPPPAKPAERKGEPLYLGVDVKGVDADFYAMTTLPGKVIGSFLGAASAVIPEGLVLQMAELLARRPTASKFATGVISPNGERITSRAIICHRPS